MASELYLIRKDGRFAKFSKVEEVALTSSRTGSPLVDSDSMLVWSSEFRDVGFTPTTSSNPAGANTYADAGSVPVQNGYVPETATMSSDNTSESLQVAGSAVKARLPDNIAHVPLRQSLIFRTHWKFDRGTSAAPRYLYATWERGDIISDNAPSR
jgi:hypothetical protein